LIEKEKQQQDYRAENRMPSNDLALKGVEAFAGSARVFLSAVGF
jgi:hypothetical protein